ncbi:hypothetical protein MXB_824, partial [Myxobolus squamalis]
REDFLRIPELAVNPLCERLVDIFFANIPPIYDSTNQGYITRVNVFAILNALVHDSISKENLDCIVDHVFNDADKNQDGKISFSEFINLMESSEIENKLTITFLK